MTQKRLLSALVVACLTFLAVGAFALPAAASHGSDDWAGDGTDHTPNFNASSSENSTYTYDEGDNTVAMNASEMVIEYDGVEHARIDNATAGNQHNDVNTTTFTLDHSKLKTLPGQPGQNTTANVTLIQYDDAGNNETHNTTFTVDFEFADDRNVMYLADGTTAFDAVSLDEQEPGFFASTLPFIGSESVPDHHTLDTTRNISGSSTDIHVFMADQNMSEDFADSVGSLGTDEVTWSVGALADDTPLFVFSDSPNEDIVDADSDTYAVYDDTDDVVTLNLGDDYDGETSTDVLVANHNVGNFEAVGFGELTDAFGYYRGTRLTLGI